MKEKQYVQKKSIFSRLVNALKNSILSDILFSEEAGQVISPEDLDSETRVTKLAHETGTDESTMWNYEKNFNEAASNLEGLEKIVSRVPDEEKASENPFKVDESELSKNAPSSEKRTSERAKTLNGQDREF